MESTSARTTQRRWVPSRATSGGVPLSSSDEICCHRFCQGWRCRSPGWTSSLVDRSSLRRRSRRNDIDAKSVSKARSRPSEHLRNHPAAARERTSKEPLMPVRLSPDLLEKRPAAAVAQSDGEDVCRPVARSPGEDGRILARRKLPHGRADLSTGQSAARNSAQVRTHQTSPAWALGYDHRDQFHLCPSEPADQRARSEHDLCDRSGTWRSGSGGTQLSRRLVH